MEGELHQNHDLPRFRAKNLAKIDLTAPFCMLGGGVKFENDGPGGSPAAQTPECDPKSESIWATLLSKVDAEISTHTSSRPAGKRSQKNTRHTRLKAAIWAPEKLYLKKIGTAV
jgi:hypothetical protein